jgi:hypothetical protein
MFQLFSRGYPLDIRPGNSFCNAGMRSLESIGGSGHLQVVEIDVRGAAFPVGFYDEEEGTGEIVAPKQSNWPVLYLCWDLQREWAREKVQGKNSELVKWAADFGEDISPIVDELLAGHFALSQSYQLFAPGTPMDRFHQILVAGGDPAALTALTQEIQWYNAPLGYLLKKRKMNNALWKLFLYRNLRWDMGNSLLTLEFPKFAPQLMADDSFRDDPLFPMLERALEEDYWEGARGYFEAGQAWEERGDRDRAWICYHNTIWLERCESERFHEDAYNRIQAINAGK